MGGWVGWMGGWVGGWVYLAEAIGDSVAGVLGEYDALWF